MRKKKNIVLDEVLVENYAAEGKSLARRDGKVIFIENVVPGDVVDIRLSKNKKDWAEGYPIRFKSYSQERVEPFCQHFGTCGGCQWQMLPYNKQLQYKQQQVLDNLTRIGKIQLPPFLPIVGADQDRFYRNKLEFTFSTREYVARPTPGPGPLPTSPNGGGVSAQPTPGPLNPPTGDLSTTQPQLNHEVLYDYDIQDGEALWLAEASPEQPDFFETADPTTYKILKEFVRQHRQNATKAESFLWEQLRGKKLEAYKFRRQHIIGNFIADFVCLAKKLIIEVDGSIHHLPDNIISDADRTAWLEMKNYTVIRFTNEEVLFDIENTLNRIQKKLDELPFAKKMDYSSKIAFTKESSTVSEPAFGFESSTGEVSGADSSPVGGGREGAVLGFHAKGFFDKIVNIEKCWLQDDVNNAIRNTLRQYAWDQELSFYDYREHQGFLRNLQLRVCTTGELMVNVVVGHEDEKKRTAMLEFLKAQFPQITTLFYTINSKKNDSISDLEPVVYSGKGYVIEKLEDFQFKIGPKSFFQTNTRQAEKLYSITREFAELDGSQTVYDLYCGTGSIGIFCSKGAKKIIGVELIDAAIKDARENAAMNEIRQSRFFSGDVIDICNDAFFAEHGRPDVIITDPPRAGMHEKLVRKILEMEAPTVVYVSCNPATQARDLSLLDEKYEVTKVQPVDMFPHTHHIENVVQLKRKNI